MLISVNNTDIENIGDVTREAYLTKGHGTANVIRWSVWFLLVSGWLWFGKIYMPLPLYVGGGILLSLIHQREINDWVHEATHWNLYPVKKWNDFWASVLGAFWFGAPITALRQEHFKHHTTKEYFIPGDPDTEKLAIHSRSDLIRGLFEDFSGIGAIKHYVCYILEKLSSNDVKQPASDGPSLLLPLLIIGAGHFVIVAALTLLGRLEIYFIYYGTLLTLYRASHRLRIYGQHLSISPEGTGQCGGTKVSRTVNCGWLDKLIFASDVMLYHNEHHDKPHLPYRALRVICERKSAVNSYTEIRSPSFKAMWNITP